MNKPECLKKGDKVAIVSLSSGILGEPFVKHEVDIALERLKAYGLEPVIMPNAMRGFSYIKEHPESRAEDLKSAFLDNDIKMIICAIGGDDTFKTLSYLMEDDEFTTAVKNNPKIFSGFSDTTINHLMFHKLGLSTFYGPCLLIDIAELYNEMLPYTKKYFEKFFEMENEFEIESSEVWYNNRENYQPEQIGIPRKVNKEEHGYETLNGNGIKIGKLYGGCLESLYDAIKGETYKEQPIIVEKYNLLPTLDEWQDKILFLETSELTPTPETLEKMLMEFKERGIFNQVQGLIIGKPMDEKYYEEYKSIYKKVFSNLDTPILYNVNFGHAVPRCILPYGLEAEIDFDNKKIKIIEPIFEKKPVLKKK